MPNEHSAVINASPVVALAAALDDFSILAQVVSRLIVPSEVIAELHAGSDRDAAADLIKSSSFCDVRPVLTSLPPLMLQSLGRGEAAVIQTAVVEAIDTVIIDDKKGRRWAKLQGLKVTGSLGVIVLLCRRGLISSVEATVSRMKTKGIFLNETIIRKAVEAARRPS